jgi:hypothetical protein
MFSAKAAGSKAAKCRVAGAALSLGSAGRPLTGQNTHDTYETRERKTDGGVINEPETDFLTIRIAGQIRAQKAALFLQVMDGSKHLASGKALSLPREREHRTTAEGKKHFNRLATGFTLSACGKT